MDRDRLSKILADHQKWLRGDGGCRANLTYANLARANLTRANLTYADLTYANLARAHLARANLARANLARAHLARANLTYANLARANLTRANLASADFANADLTSADLTYTNLASADFANADLARTVLDPENGPNAKWPMKPTRAGYIIGYRTREAGHIDAYRDGRYYSADVFSTCEVTECHPGLYLWPTLEGAYRWSGRGAEIIKVRTKISEVHQAGYKWRCRWFEVLGRVEEE